jgi:predicted membrane channel-forming protein YqfA (hemolysin III family)
MHNPKLAVKRIMHIIGRILRICFGIVSVVSSVHNQKIHYRVDFLILRCTISLGLSNTFYHVVFSNAALLVYCSYLPYQLMGATSHYGEVGRCGCFLQLRAWQLALSWFGGSPSTLILSWQLDGCASNLILT